MEKLTKLLFSATLLATLLFFNSCKKDNQDTDNNQPVLNVGGDIIGMTDVISNLSVSASDPDGDELQIKWNIIKAPAGSDAVIMSTGLFTATSITSVPGKYEVEVVASDGHGKSASGIIILYIGGVLPTSIKTNTVYPDIFESKEYPDYYALKTISVTAGLTLAPGVVVECGADVRFVFNDNSAYLNAEGTSVKNIIFRGVDKVKGSWNTIYIGSNNINNKLNFVKIQHAGSSVVSNQKTALFLKSNASAQISIRNTTITESGGYAFYVDGNGGSITAFSNNNFSDNQAAPMRVGASHLFSLDKNSVFTNNGIQAVEVSGGSYAEFNDVGIVPALSIPYHFHSDLFISTKITFEPGVTCLFNQGLRIWVQTSGTLIADGTASQKITFSGIEQSAGSWKGIELSSASSLNKINYGIVEYGGGTVGRKANIYMFNPSKLTLTNSTISNSQTWGVTRASGSTDLTESNNTFSNNISGNISGN